MRRNTTAQLLLWAYRHIDQLDAEALLAHVLKYSREYLLAHSDRGVSFLHWRRFRRFVGKRAQGVPLAYLTGHKEFFGLNFIVNKHVLVPRPETETIVEAVIDKLQTTDCRLRTVLIDVGAGSGCIPISIAKALKKIPPLVRQRTDPPVADREGEGWVTFIATDISRRALRVARKNAWLHNINIIFLHGHLLQPMLSRQHLNASTHQHIMITANLPYLTAAQYQSEPTIQFEPKLALVADDNGLALYKMLINQIQLFISSFPHFSISCFFEIDPSQSKHIVALIRQRLPQAKVEIKPDLAWRERVMIIEMTKNQDGICLCL